MLRPTYEQLKVMLPSFAKAASRLRVAPHPERYAYCEVSSTILTALPRYGLAAASQQFAKNAQPA
jgi:hypothetical protein